MSPYRALAVAFLAALLSGALATGGPAGPPADDLKIIVRRPAIRELLVAATPYQVDVGTSLLSERLTFVDPRDLEFRDGKITFAIRCQGSPFPVDVILRPVLVLRRGGSGGGYQAVVESLPVTIPGFGALDLKEIIPPIEIQSLVRERILLQGRPADVDVRVKNIAVRPEQIEVEADLSLRPAPKR